MNQHYLIKWIGLEHYYAGYGTACPGAGGSELWRGKAHAVKFTTYARAAEYITDRGFEHAEIVPETKD